MFVGMTGWLLVGLTVVSVAALGLLGRVVRAASKRHLLEVTGALTGDAAGGVGISVLCSGMVAPDCIERLLAVEYAHYEVIAVLDRERFPEVFARLVSRYRMIRVAGTGCGDLPVRGVRSLERSRRRGFRRLVLIDRAWDGAAGDFDAAADVADYEYLLPFRCDGELLPEAIERLAAEAGEFPPGVAARIRAPLGVPLTLYAREAVVAAGGFGDRPARRVPRRYRRVVWEPLCAPLQPVRRMPRAMGWLVAMLLVGGLWLAVSAGSWRIVAVLLTVALSWTVMACIRMQLVRVLGERAERACGGVSTFVKFQVKNFMVR